jgi:hypothetical protein
MVTQGLSLDADPNLNRQSEGVGGYGASNDLLGITVDDEGPTRRRSRGQVVKDSCFSLWDRSLTPRPAAGVVCVLDGCDQLPVSALMPRRHMSMPN